MRSPCVLPRRMPVTLTHRGGAMATRRARAGGCQRRRWCPPRQGWYLQSKTTQQSLLNAADPLGLLSLLAARSCDRREATVKAVTTTATPNSLPTVDEFFTGRRHSPIRLAVRSGECEPKTSHNALILVEGSRARACPTRRGKAGGGRSVRCLPAFWRGRKVPR
jgi:hypothetical protein